MLDSAGRKKRVSKKNTDNSLNILIDNLELRFPTPIYLVLSNMNEQVQNAQQMSEFITLTYYPDDPTGQQATYEHEIKKAKFKKELYKKHFLPSLEWEAYDKIYELVEQDGVKDVLNQNINFTTESKPKNELDALEEDEY
jgi:hypothetical protein